MVEQKLVELKNIIKDLKSAVVAFSGGIDSTFLLKMCNDVLGKSNVLGVTIKSELLPNSEIYDAKTLAQKLDARHKIVDFNICEVQNITDNPPDRCYYCKYAFFNKLKDIATIEKLNFVVDGSNFDDLRDFRPGMKALHELEILSPLKEAGLTKNEIRTVSKQMGIPTWDKPSFACLASRFPYGEKITKEKLKRVEKAEKTLAQLGFSQHRVRSHGNIARIEILPSEMVQLSDETIRNKIINDLKSFGFTYVTIDLTGYRTGSMNEELGR